MQVTSRVAPTSTRGTLAIGEFSMRTFKIAQILQYCEGRRIQIRRATDQRRKLWRYRVENFSRCGAGGHSFSVRREVGNCPVPALRQLAAYRLFQFCGHVGKFLSIGGESLVPFRLGSFSLADGVAETSQRFFGNQKWRLKRPAELLLRPLYFLQTQRRAVGLEGILLTGRSVTDVRAQQNERRPRGLAAGRAQCSVDGFEIVSILHRLRMPAIRLEAFCAIFREREIGRSSERNMIIVVEVNQLA